VDHRDGLDALGASTAEGLGALALPYRSAEMNTETVVFRHDGDWVMRERLHRDPRAGPRTPGQGADSAVAAVLVSSRDGVLISGIVRGA
jgi:hypothetical protein